MNHTSTVNLVEADRTKCCGYGMCAEVCPDVFGLDESGLVVAKITEVPDDLMEAAEEAVYLCPAEALSIRRSAD